MPETSSDSIERLRVTEGRTVRKKERMRVLHISVDHTMKCEFGISFFFLSFIPFVLVRRLSVEKLLFLFFAHLSKAGVHAVRPGVLRLVSCTCI